MNRKDRAKQIKRFFELMTEKMNLTDDEKLEIPDLFEEYNENKTYDVGKTLKHKGQLVKVSDDKKLHSLEKSKK